jgi:tetratricopeptide (TPR) repeat protein/predicted Ser/Thr protein kinase
MSKPPIARASGFADESGPLEEIVERFEQAWQEGRQPEVQDYLPPDNPLRATVLVELVYADLEHHLKSGGALRVEDYLRRFPELGADPGLVLDLIVREYELRQQREGMVPFAEYARRFRPFREQLRRRWRAPAGRETAPGPWQQPTLPLAAGEPSDAPADTWPDVPGYEIREKVGSGGMGVVYRAWQISLKRAVALKVVKGEVFAEAAERALFQREAEVVARLRHPHIVQVYEAGEHRGQPYFAMEYADGGSLDRLLNGKPLPADGAARLLATLAEAIHHAHQQQIVHRDLKPANVVLMADGSPKVTDFGLAKQLAGQESLQSNGALLGTPEYMAPEQALARSGEVGPSTDIHALGAILYATLTGRPPFQAANVYEVLQQVVGQEPVPPRRLNPAVPRDLETVCLKCLEKAPSKRYRTARALAEDLQRFLEHRPVTARPLVWPGRAFRWSQRNPLAAGLLATLLTVFLAAFGTVLFLWGRAEASRRDAEASRKEVGEERNRADANFQEARQVVNQLTQVSVRRLQQLPPGMQPLRKELLESALRFYQRLLAQGVQDRQVQAEAAELYFLNGTLSEEQGARAEAASAFQEAVAIYRQLAQEDPTDDNCPIRLAECSTALGSVYQAIGRHRDAETSWRIALELLAALAQGHPDVPGYRSMLVRAYQGRGSLHRAAGAFDLSETDYQEAQTVLQQLHEKEPANPGYRQQLANNQASLAQLYADAERWERAETAARAALQAWQGLVEEFRDNITYPCGLAEGHNNLAYLYRDQGRLREALQHNQDALAIAGVLADKNPLAPFSRGIWANSLLGAGSSYRLLGDRVKADECLEKALPLWQQLHTTYPEEVWYAISLGETYVQLGALRGAERNYAEARDRYAEAIQSLEAVLARDGGNTDAKSWLCQACAGRGRVYARGGRTNEAVEELRRALELSPVRRRDRLRDDWGKDEELAPLQGQDDFRRLLQGGH